MPRALLSRMVYLFRYLRLVSDSCALREGRFHSTCRRKILLVDVKSAPAFTPKMTGRHHFAQ